MSNAPLPATVKCLACGYDLRGNDSQRCPECGASRELETIAIHDAAQYHRARAALEHARILAAWVDPGGTLGPLQIVEFGRQIPGWLSIHSTNMDRAEEILDQLGIPHSINARPIVDRAEPQCPACDATLDPSGTEQCAQCGAFFTWVEIDDAMPS